MIHLGDLQHIFWFHESAAEVSISSQGYCDNLLGFYQLRETWMKTVTQVCVKDEKTPWDQSRTLSVDVEVSDVG
ncbi:hypothetical protein DPEC_G00155760 [Dallia pectoralis]|uniref:Uncharacterized protein n=1 Tax=Dallia pectoralis TaxID=75939 RepID=A0ACC2GL18_DALPE|nr:hypothetical protein DPEC_G00155760 [Dallia pectoralis]